MFSSLAVFAVLAASPVSGVKMTPMDEPTVTVSAHDLNLADPAQEQRMERRIANAVDAVCRTHRAPGVAAAARYAECRTTAMAGARAQVDRMVAAARKSSPVALARK